jgi:hypothetical protein
MGLFKYCGESGLHVLRNLELRATPPIEFNDPFEFSPVVRTKDPKTYAEQQVKEILSCPRFYEAHKTHFPQCKDFAEFQSFASTRKEYLIRLMETETPNLDAMLDVLGTISQVVGVICFSADPLQPLMWAHYASSHRGLVLQFDENDPVFNNESFLKVDYDATRVEYDQNESDPMMIGRLFAKRKSPHWQYEQEYRLVLELELARKHNNGQGVMYLFKFEPMLLKSVTLGLRVSEANRDEVLSLAGKSPLEHVEVFQVETDKNEFKLHRRRIK